MSLPWLRYTPDLELHARVIDYWQDGHTISGKLAAYLRNLGFEVSAEAVERWQIGASCGIVAAEAVVIMRLAEQGSAGAWQHAMTTGATKATVLKSTNQRQTEWARSEECVDEESLRRQPTRTRFLWTDEVLSLVHKSWDKVRAPVPDEAEGPPCAR